jgi:hypothetical protein
LKLFSTYHPTNIGEYASTSCLATDDVREPHPNATNRCGNFAPRLHRPIIDASFTLLQLFMSMSFLDFLDGNYQLSTILAILPYLDVITLQLANNTSACYGPTFASAQRCTIHCPWATNFSRGLRSLLVEPSVLIRSACSGLLYMFRPVKLISVLNLKPHSLIEIFRNSSITRARETFEQFRRPDKPLSWSCNGSHEDIRKCAPE